MRVEWLVKEANPKWSYEKARNKVSEELELGLKFLIVYLVHTAHLTNTKKRYELKPLIL